MSISARRFQRVALAQGALVLSGQPSTFYAAGFHQSLHIADPTVHGDVVLSTGDVHGLTRSSDSGLSWSMINRDILSNANKYARSVTSHPTQAGVMYAANGSGGYQITKSTDYGVRWTLRNAVRFGSADTSAETGSSHPRRVQNLLVVDPTTSGVSTVLYAGLGDGLYRSTNDAVSWSALPTASGDALNASAVTAVALDPQDSTILYACTDSGSTVGLYKITNVKGPGNAIVTEIKTGGIASGNSLPDGQDLCCVINSATSHTEVWVAAGASTTASLAGIFRYIVGTDTMHNVTPAGMNVNPTRWSGIDVRVQPSTNNLLVLTSASKIQAGSSSTWRHLSGQTLTSGNKIGWIDVVMSDTISKKIVNASGNDYWLYSYSSAFMVDGSAWATSSVQIHPTNPNIALLAGRSVVVRSDNFLSANASWYMSSVGYGSTAVYGLTAHPSDSNKLFYNSVDWEHGTSTDGLMSAQPRLKGISGSGPSWSSTLDSNGIGYVGASDTNSGDGGATGVIYTIPDPFATTISPSDMGIGANLVTQGVLAAASDLGSPRAILSLYNGATRKLNIFINGIGGAPGGIVHKSGSGAASLVRNLGTGAGGAFQSSFAYQTDSGGVATGVIFLFTHTHGLYRSNNWGLTWELVWAFSLNSNDEIVRVTGDLFCKPASSSLYITALFSNGTCKLYRIDSANTPGSTITTTGTGPYTVTASGGCSITDISGGIDVPGRIGFDPVRDRLIIAQPLQGNGGGMLYVSSPIGNETAAPNFTDYSFSGWQQHCMFPLGLMVANSRLYCRTDGMGMYIVTISG